MLGCTFIFNKSRWFRFILFVLLFLFHFSFVFAQSSNHPANASEEKPRGDDEVLSGPFSDYGEFDSEESEIEDERFFQYSRFFGVGIGTGFTSATSNASKLYQGGFPMVDFRLNYWFDFNLALQLAVQNSKHNYDAPPDGPTDVNLFRILGQIKYYIDTRNLSAAIAFVGPHLIAGGGFYQRTDNIGSGSSTTAVTSVQTQQAFGMNFGAGFELTLSPKRSYIDLEFLYHLVQFRDQFDPKFKNVGIPDRSGNWLTGGVAIVWTW